VRNRVGGNRISLKQRILYMLEEEAKGLQECCNLECGRDFAKRLCIRVLIVFAVRYDRRTRRLKSQFTPTCLTYSHEDYIPRDLT